MVKEGYFFGLPPLVLGGGAFLLHWNVTAAAPVLLALFVFFFFRDPERVVPSERGAVVSPADGRVVFVSEEESEGRPAQRLNIFLASWNCGSIRGQAFGNGRRMEYRT